MKIVHFCLSCFYIDNYTYQENVLPKLNAASGHDVIIVASTETFLENKKIGYTASGKYLTKEGIELFRLDYKKILPRFIMKKIRMYSGVNQILNSFQPDIIYFHGLAAFELINITNYVKRNPHVRFCLDSHEDQYNSGTNFISKYLLHRGLYRYVINVTKRYYDIVYYVSYEVVDFIQKNYKYFGKSSFLPLGGVVLEDSEYICKRNNFRERHNIDDDQIVYFHSGKMDKSKRTLELISSYIISGTTKKLFIAGSVSKEIETEFYDYINNNENITYLGWQDSEEMSELFCGSDVYLQPGTQSVSMQQALCSRCIVALYPYSSHEYLLNDNYLKLISSLDMQNMFENIDKENIDIEGLRLRSFKIATELLDYNMQSKIYLKDFLK